MQYRMLGKTGLMVSALSLGGSPLGNAFRQIDEEKGIRTVRLALDLGVNLIDTAPWYGATRSESSLGRALHGISRDTYYLATKVGRYPPHSTDFSAQRVTAGLDESLARLGLDYVDLLLCHDIQTTSLDQIVNETLPALRKLQQLGKARFIGITGLPLKVFPYVLDRADVDAILSFSHYTLQDDALLPLLPYLKAKHVGVINGSPLSMGLLTEAGAPAWHPATPDVRALVAEATDFCRLNGSSISKLALQFSVANPDIATTLSGTASPDNLANNLRWIEEPIDQAVLAGVLKILAPIHNWAWTDGLPENN